MCWVAVVLVHRLCTLSIILLNEITCKREANQSTERIKLLDSQLNIKPTNQQRVTKLLGGSCAGAHRLC